MVVFGRGGRKIRHKATGLWNEKTPVAKVFSLGCYSLDEPETPEVLLGLAWLRVWSYR